MEKLFSNKTTWQERLRQLPQLYNASKGDIIAIEFFISQEIESAVREEREEEFEKIIYFCSRCGGKYKPLGKIIKYGKHYPAYTIKFKDGKEEYHAAEDEIKEALCKECAKEFYDKSHAFSQFDNQTYTKMKKNLTKQNTRELYFYEGKVKKIVDYKDKSTYPIELRGDISGLRGEISGL